jgi:hypothetical protein
MRKRQTTNSGRNSNELLSLSSNYIEKRPLDINSTPRNHLLLSERHTIPLKSEVQLLNGSWRMDPNSKYFVSTGFSNSVLSIVSNSGIDSVSITSTGVKNLSVTCVEQKEESFTARSSEQRKEVLEVSISNSMVDDQDFPLQQISFNTPWPCSHLEASFVPFEGSFISILQISTYCDSMPSSMSTPIK